MVEGTIAVVVSSGKPKRFSEWMDECWPRLAMRVRLLIVPWGDHWNAIKSLAPSTTEFPLEGRPGSSFEHNANAAIDYLATADPPSIVAFLDDDTIVGDLADSSVVVHRGEDRIQSCGHFFVRAAPRDILSITDAAARGVLCPCSNCTVVKWDLIVEIRAIDQSIWDPRFVQWQTCFDAGLKMLLCGGRTVLASEARAEHSGYLTWDKATKDQRCGRPPSANSGPAFCSTARTCRQASVKRPFVT